MIFAKKVGENQKMTDNINKITCRGRTMRLNSGIHYNDNGLTTSIRAMHLQSEIIAIGNENITDSTKSDTNEKKLLYLHLLNF